MKKHREISKKDMPFDEIMRRALAIKPKKEEDKKKRDEKKKAK